LHCGATLVVSKAVEKFVEFPSNTLIKWPVHESLSFTIIGLPQVIQKTTPLLECNSSIYFVKIFHVLDL
jgi:hypothetical protein